MMGVIARAGAWIAMGIGGWFGYELLTQNGRLLLRVEALEAQLAQLTGTSVTSDAPVNGLPVGSVVLDFALPTLSGDIMTLSQWRGRQVVLIFFDPQCDFCRQMLPDLAKLEMEPTDGRPVPLVISTGSPEEHRRLVNEWGIRCTVLLQDHHEVSQLYQVNGTPTGYLIDEHGATTTPLTVGSQAVLALASVRPSARPPDHETLSQGYTALPQVDALASSRITRSGLKAGKPAPRFHLPLVSGGTLRLDEFLGRDVLLVFSDPECAPCHDLAPKLERVHQRSPALQVLMISRGDPEVNRAKIAEQGLTFPVVLQRRWEISRDYGMFATPIGYLIDERGVIVTDVAVGADAILALAAAKVPSRRRNEEVAM